MAAPGPPPRPGGLAPGAGPFDAMVRRPPDAGPPFTPLVATTRVLAAKIDAPRRTHKELMAELQQRGEPTGGIVVAINSNYGGVAIPSATRFLKTGAKPKPPAPPGRKHRQPEGMGGSFNSALEPVLRPVPGTAVWRALEAIGRTDAHFKLKYFPTRGTMQVAGGLLPDSSDAIWAVEAWVDYLNRTQLLRGTARVVPGSMHPEMVNFKFALRRRSSRQVINFPELARCLLQGLAPDLPAPVIPTTIKMPTEGAASSFRLSVTAKKCPRVNIFIESGRVNFLGTPSDAFGLDLYTCLSRLFATHWDQFVFLKPAADDAPVGPADEIQAALDYLNAFRAIDLGPPPAAGLASAAVGRIFDEQTLPGAPAPAPRPKKLTAALDEYLLWAPDAEYDPGEIAIGEDELARLLAAWTRGAPRDPSEADWAALTGKYAQLDRDPEAAAIGVGRLLLAYEEAAAARGCPPSPELDYALVVELLDALGPPA